MIFVKIILIVEFNLCTFLCLWEVLLDKNLN